MNEESAHSLLKTAPAFVDSLLLELSNLGVEVAGLPIDHICCRAETMTDYLRLTNEFSVFGELLTEAPVNGRPISTFKLKCPIEVGTRAISLIEIPAPKPGSPYKTGLEHCEFVTIESFECLKNRHPQLRWDTRGASKAVNPELVLELPTRGQNPVCVKFHHQSLELVIAEEIRQARLNT